MANTRRGKYRYVKEPEQPIYYEYRQPNNKSKKKYLTNTEKSVLNLQWEEGEDTPDTFRQVRKPNQHDKSKEILVVRRHSNEPSRRRRPVQYREYYQPEEQRDQPREVYYQPEEQPEFKDEPILVSNSTTSMVDRSYKVKPKPTLYHHANNHTAVPIIEQHTRVVPQYSPLETSRTVIRTTQPERNNGKVTRTTQTEIRTTPPERTSRTVIRTTQPEITSRAVTRATQTEPEIRIIQPERTSRTVIRTTQPERISRAVTRTTQTEIRTTQPEFYDEPILVPNSPRSIVDHSYEVKPKPTLYHYTSTHTNVPVIEQRTQVVPQYSEPETSRSVTRITNPERRPSEKAIISLRGENPVQVEHRYVNSQEDADGLIAELRRRGFLKTQIDPSE